MALIVKFLRRNWFGIIGITIGITGFILSFYLYRTALRSPEPFFLIDPISTKIIDSDRISETSIRVLKLNGESIMDNVISKRFYFWNASRTSVKASNILEPLVITLNDPNSEILDYTILKYSRQVVRPVLSRNLTNEKRSLSISFNILEFQDGLTGQVIYTGDPNSNLIISGTIEGVRKIRTNAEAALSRSRKIMCYLIILLFALWLSFVIRIILRYRKISKLDSSLDIRGKIRKMKRQISILCIMTIFSFWMGRISLIAARKEAANSVIEAVPEVLVYDLSKN